MIKKFLLACTLALLAPFCFGQSYPSPTYQNVTIQGTLGVTGLSTLSGGATVSSNFTATGLSTLSGGATVSSNFTATGLVTLPDLATQAANTVIANVTGSSASPTAYAMPSCSGPANALQYASGTGIICGTGYALLSSPAFNGTPTAPTPAYGNNSTQLATTAFVANRGPCANIVDFGGDPSGVNNNDTAFTNTVSAASNLTLNKCVYFPPGTYKFASQAGFTFTASNQAITIIGAGQDVTKLYWPANGGLGFSYLDCTDSVHVENLTILPGTTNAGEGITFINPSATSIQSCALNTVHHVSMYSASGYFGPNYFIYDVLVQGVSNINFDSLQFIGPSGGLNGTGILFESNSHNIVPIDYTISNSEINTLNTAIQIGALVQGVIIGNSSFTGNTYGLYVPASESGINMIAITNSQFNSNASGFNIYVLSAFPDLMVTNTLFLINNNSSGINVQSSSATTIVGNTFQGNTGSPTNAYGVIMNGYVNGGTIITGNLFYTLTNGVTLQSTSGGVSLQSNNYQNVTSPYSNAHGAACPSTSTANCIGTAQP